MNTTIQSRFTIKRIYSALCIAIALTLFLFFIDEGYYSFKWMADYGNWFVFLIYVFMLFAAQLFMIAFLYRRKTNRLSESVLLISGVIIGLASLFYLFR